MNSKINDLFVPYEMSVLLFEKNFNEECIAVYYYNNGEFNINILNDNTTIKNSDIIIENLDTCFPAPLFVQVYEWLQQKFYTDYSYLFSLSKENKILCLTEIINLI